MPLFRCEGQLWGSRLEQVVFRDSHEKAKPVKTANHCACEYNCEAGSCCSGGLGREAEGCVSKTHQCRFLLFFVLLPWSYPLQLVAGAASAQAQKRVRHSDVGHAECEGLPVPVSALVPGPAAGVSHSAAVVAPLVGHSSPSLDGTESKLDDPSAAAVLDGGAVASATDGMEDVVVLEPEAAAGVAAHNTWTLPQALESSLSPVSG
jgi:hypothetical protein